MIASGRKVTKLLYSEGEQLPVMEPELEDVYKNENPSNSVHINLAIVF